ncbi:MAG TPA: family 1 glycosylhydrolase [Actinomycetota bacterium]|nr:family 1 glycosylhydrolase [Actinomycetota bacterium]
MLVFPETFVWGAATSAHQVEGGQENDWTVWEQTGACAEPSGEACRHYDLFADDIALLASLGFGSYRFSIEWSRVEPESGIISSAAVDHYRRVIDTCHTNGLQAAVAFHHFTNPIWIARSGGWENPATPARFARFCESTARAFGRDIDMAITINEPNMPPLLGYVDGVFPPGKRDGALRELVTSNYIAAHEQAREAVSRYTDAPIGMALAMADWQAVPGGEQELEKIRSIREDVFLESARADDYVGVNTYTRHRVGAEGFMDVEAGLEVTAMGYEFHPRAIDATVRRAADLTGRPIVVTESGIGTDDDNRRIAFIEGALEATHSCLADGVDVRGYYYWSALDNFEWHHGYRPKFGLVAVDRETQERKVKRSGIFLGEVARTGRLSRLSSPPDPGRQTT